jgi:TFIIF-interacting CTD phosphatase-like protein
MMNCFTLCTVQVESYLLQPVRVQDKNKKCVVIDLDETLVHSSFTVSSSEVRQFMLFQPI